jgi:DNA-binding NtrC family response regulator
LITATNLAWDELEKRLAPDFLDRISYFTVEMPPLRETPEDLPILWSRVLQTASERADVPSEIVTAVTENRRSIVRHLKEHPLRGNFRDLFRLAYYIFAYAADSNIQIDEAVERGLRNGLSEPHPPGTDQAEIIRRSFGKGESLPPEILEIDPSIDTSAALKRLRRYLAGEIRRLHRLHGKGDDPGEICDVSSRSLQKWMKH